MQPSPNPDQFTRKTPLTKEELVAYRRQMTGDDFDILYTCDRCSCAHVCLCAFDGYNTDGDCLYAK